MLYYIDCNFSMVVFQDLTIYLLLSLNKTSFFLLNFVPHPQHEAPKVPSLERVFLLVFFWRICLLFVPVSEFFYKTLLTGKGVEESFFLLKQLSIHFNLSYWALNRLFSSEELRRAWKTCKTFKREITSSTTGRIQM